MRMAWAAIGLLGACSAAPAHPYSTEAAQAFAETCAGGEAFCACAWEGLTRAMPAEDYDAALVRFQETGLMDPRIVRVRAACLEKTG